MTKYEANAILRYEGQINRAVRTVLSSLSAEEHRQAEAYWLPRLEYAMRFVPIEQAKKVLSSEV